MQFQMGLLDKISAVASPLTLAEFIASITAISFEVHEACCVTLHYPGASTLAHEILPWSRPKHFYQKIEVECTTTTVVVEDVKTRRRPRTVTDESYLSRSPSSDGSLSVLDSPRSLHLIVETGSMPLRSTKFQDAPPLAPESFLCLA